MKIKWIKGIKLKQSPIVFIEEVLGVNLFEFQKEAIRLILEGKTDRTGHNLLTKAYRNLSKS